MRRYTPLFAFLALVIMLALFAGFHAYKTSYIPSGSGDPMVGLPLPAFTLPSLYEKDDPLTNTRITERKELVLINVFASWCVACIQEHAVLSEAAKHHALPLYGIAWKDQLEAAQNWLEKRGNHYEAVGMDYNGRAAINLGLTGVPETYLVGPNGRIVATFRGAVTQDIFNAAFLPHIEYWRKKAQQSAAAPVQE